MINFERIAFTVNVCSELWKFNKTTVSGEKYIFRSEIRIFLLTILIVFDYSYVFNALSMYNIYKN